MSLCILILHFETPDITGLLVNSIPCSIVIDNGSAKDKRVATDHQVIQLDKNYGFSEGWNKGIKEAMKDPRYTSFWLMNSDIIIYSESVNRITELANSGKYDILTPAYNCWIKECQPKEGGGLVQIPVIEFTAPVISRKVFEKIGFFNSELFPKGYGVEFDFCERARQNKFKIWSDQGSWFEHIGCQTITHVNTLKHYVTAAKVEHSDGMTKLYGPKYWEVVKGYNQIVDSGRRIAIYTTIFGDYDTLKPHAWSQFGAKWYCVTDNPKLKCEGWDTVVFKCPVPGLTPRMQAKYFKMFPWECLPADTEISIFIDGSVEVTSESFIEYCILHLFTDMTLYKHPWRDDIYQEVNESRKLRKYDSEPLEKQVESYRSIVSEHSGLYECGVLIRKHSKLIKHIMMEWWKENLKWSYQDQLSFQYVCLKHNFKPTVFFDNRLNERNFKVHNHEDK